MPTYFQKRNSIRLLHFAEFRIKGRGSNLVTKYGIEKMIRAPKDDSSKLGA